MRNPRVDIRMARKSNPVNPPVNTRSLRKTTKQKSQNSKSPDRKKNDLKEEKAKLSKSNSKKVPLRKSVESSKKVPVTKSKKKPGRIPNSRKQKPVVEDEEVKEERTVESDEHIDSRETTTNKEVDTDSSRRRRIGSTDYIQRRFLYDVPEAPRRSHRKRQHSASNTGVASNRRGQRKGPLTNSAVALLAASAAHLVSKKSGKRKKAGARRGRPASTKVEVDHLLDSDDQVEPSSKRRKMEQESDLKMKRRKMRNSRELSGRRRSKSESMEEEHEGSNISEQSDFFVQPISSDHLPRLPLQPHRQSRIRRSTRTEDEMDQEQDFISSVRPGGSEDDFAYMVDEEEEEDFSGDLLSPGVIMGSHGPLGGPSGTSHGLSLSGSGRRKSPIRPMQVLPVDSSAEQRQSRMFRTNSPFAASQRRRGFPGSVGGVMGVGGSSPPGSSRHFSMGDPNHSSRGVLEVDDTVQQIMRSESRRKQGDVDEAVQQIMRSERNNRQGHQSRSGPMGVNSQSVGGPPVRPKPKAQQGPRTRPSILQRKSGAQASSSKVTTPAPAPTTTAKVSVSSGGMTQSVVSAPQPSADHPQQLEAVLTAGGQSYQLGAGHHQPLQLLASAVPQRLAFLPQAKAPLTASAKLFGKRQGSEERSMEAIPSGQIRVVSTSLPIQRQAFLTTSSGGSGSVVTSSNGVPIVLKQATPVQYTMVRGGADGKNLILLSGGHSQQSGSVSRASIVRTSARSLLRTSGGPSGVPTGGSVILVRGSDGIQKMVPAATQQPHPSSQIPHTHSSAASMG